VYANPILEDAVKPLRGKSEGVDAIFYWLASEELSREVHCRIYGDDQRVAIFGQQTEGDVRYVLSHIVRNC
jgi:hypothetical protein